MTPAESIPDSLPPVKIFRQAASHDNAWSDHYGALHTAAAYAGLTLPGHYAMRAIWMHGCGGPWLETVPETLYLNSPRGKTWPVFVARHDEVEWLRRHGCASAQAIGLPMVYTRESGRLRQPGSLLVMPCHTLIGDAEHERAAFERYADEIVAVAGKFQRVVACVHPNCLRNGLWVREFTDRGVEIVYGAQTNDLNALGRMRALFEQFEFVTTNGWGGHVAYALAFGAKLSIHGTLPKRSEADLLRDTTWAADQNSLKATLSDIVQLKRDAWLADFQRPPDEGLADLARGRWLIGWDNRLAPAAMKQVLATMVPNLLEYEAVHRARGERQAARKEAARLVASGRPVEATQLLLRFVRSAADSKNAKLIHETLIEISADLRPLDPPRAAQLEAQAQRLLAMVEAARRPAA